MSFNIGLNVVEVDGRVAPSIQPAPTSVTGFIIKAQRGILGTVVQVTNWSQFVEHFGSFVPDAYGAYAVRGFFDNGGTIAHITRVANTTPGDATAPSINTNDGPWALTPGGTLSFTTDLAGGPLAVVFNADGAALAGGTGPFDLDAGGGSGMDISLTVNGVAHGPFQFVASDFAGGLTAATALEVAAVLNREFPGIQAWVSTGDNLLRVRTDRRGTSASLAVSGSAAAVLNLGGPANGGGNLADIDAVTPAEAHSLIAAALTPSGLIVTQTDQHVTITHPNTGAASTIQVVAGADTTDTTMGLDNAVHAGSGSDPSQAAAASTVTVGALTVTAGYRGQPDLGAWGDALSVQISVNAQDATLFDLTVLQDNVSVETWTGLNLTPGSPDFAPTRINDEFAGSKFITAASAGGANPAPGAAVPLQNGRDGAFANGTAEANALSAAIDLYEIIDIQLMACPESTDQIVVSKALTHCQSKGDRMFAGHTPFDMDADASKAYGRGFRGDKVYGALYFPWIRVADPLGGQKWIPPTGHVLGVYARTERERGIWKAPAGNAARLNNALDVHFNITDVVHTDLVKNGSVNAVRFVPGQGIIIDSSRTLSTSTLWLYVNVRLLFNFVKSSLKYGLRWVVQEPNDDTLWNKVKFNSVTPFLMGLWRRGAFGPGAPADVFTVKVDAENNPPANIQQGILTIEVYFYPSRPAETIILIIGQQEGGATASEG